MKKTIKIDKETDLALSNNVSWLMEYREQFGHDIVPDLLPIVSAVSKLIMSLSDQLGKPVTEILKTLPDDVLQDALIELSSAQFVDFLKIVWAMAKAADDDIDEPKRWLKQFDVFPLDVIAPAIWEMMLSGFVSSKNLKRLNGTEAMKKSVSTTSSLQQQKEDSPQPTSEE